MLYVSCLLTTGFTFLPSLKPSTVELVDESMLGLGFVTQGFLGKKFTSLLSLAAAMLCCDFIWDLFEPTLLCYLLLVFLSIFVYFAIAIIGADVEQSRIATRLTFEIRFTIRSILFKFWRTLLTRARFCSSSFFTSLVLRQVNPARFLSLLFCFDFKIRALIDFLWCCGVRTSLFSSYGKIRLFCL